MQYIGIVVSEDHLDVATPEKESGRFDYTDAGIKSLLATVQTPQVRLVVLEATGGLENALAVRLASAGIAVAIVNPRQVRDFARSTGAPGKTGRVDARMLALFAEQIQSEAGSLGRLHLHTRNFRRALNFYSEVLGLALEDITVVPETLGPCAHFLNGSGECILKIYEANEEDSADYAGITFVMPSRTWYLLRARLDTQNYPYKKADSLIIFKDMDGRPIQVRQCHDMIPIRQDNNAGTIHPRRPQARTLVTID